MDYFFSRCVRNIKRTVSLISGGSCIAIVTLSLLGINRKDLTDQYNK